MLHIRALRHSYRSRSMTTSVFSATEGLTPALGVQRLDSRRAPWLQFFMQKLTFSVEISAPVRTVWNTMLDDEPYRQWTSVFEPDSYYEGSWDLGSEIRFIGPGEDGQSSGVIATVIERRQDEYIAAEMTGQIVGGKRDTDSDDAKKIAGAQESYTFSERNGVTTVTAEPETEDEYVEDFNRMWPQALLVLKKLAELRAASGPPGSDSGSNTTINRSFTLVRYVDAPPAEVFRAWTDPEQLDWFFNTDQQRPATTEVDLRVGGQWRQLMVIDEQTRYVTGGIYREIEPGTRLVFVWGAVDGWPALDPDRLDEAPITTIDFDQAGDGTVMTFRLDLPENPDARLLGAAVRTGWSQTIGRLVAQFARSESRT